MGENERYIICPICGSLCEITYIYHEEYVIKHIGGVCTVKIKSNKNEPTKLQATEESSGT
jgi:formylmethanofuran dehydrogenase subunit B